jgi:hypothetical protein
MLTLATTGQGTSDASKACAQCDDKPAHVCSEPATLKMLAFDSVKRQLERARSLSNPTALACGALVHEKQCR